MEQHNPLAPEVTFVHHHDNSTFKKRVIKTTVLLSVITLIELGIGIILYFMHEGGNIPNQGLVLALKGAVCIFTLAKAYYIIAIFMHLGDEMRRFVLTVGLPALLFIWFIIAFLWDGAAYRNMRNQYDKHFYETTTPKHMAPAATPATTPADSQRQ